MKKNEITIIAPCYNEEKNINEFYNRILLVLKKINLINYKIIFIDDGSIDKSWIIINDLAKVNPKILGIKLSRNFGHQNAIKSSFKHISSNFIFFIDVDLQDPPELLEQMYQKIIKEDLNVVYAQRNKRDDNIFKKISAKLFYSFFNLISSIKIPNQVSDFKIIDEKVFSEIIRLDEAEPFLRGLISWTGFKQSPISFDREKRKKGKSGWSIKKMFNFSMNAFFGFSIFPMRLSFLISIILSIIFLLFGTHALYTYFMGKNIPGWTSIFLIIIMFNIFQFFILGLISEYTGRIYLEVKKRPNYIIDEIISLNENSK